MDGSIRLVLFVHGFKIVVSILCMCSPDLPGGTRSLSLLLLLHGPNGGAPPPLAARLVRRWLTGSGALRREYVYAVVTLRGDHYSEYCRQP